MKRPAVFFDRDNTLIASDGYLGDPEGVVLVEGAAELVARVRRLGYATVTFSNQSGVARGLFTEQDVHRVNSKLDEMLLDHEAGAVIDRHEFCPHHPEAVVPRYRQASEFRKPSPGMIYQAARQLGLDLGRSWVVGDASRDVEAGRAAGCRTILFKDPTLPPSAAVREPLSVEPDFVAASLKEVADLIESNPLAEEAEPEAPAIEPDGGAEEVAGDNVEQASSSEDRGSQEQTSPAEDRGLPAAAMMEPSSEEQEQTAAAPVEAAVFEEPAAVPEHGSPQPAQEQVMEDRSAPGPAPASGDDSDQAVRRRSPPAVILAAKAAREAARNSAPGASPEVLREVARNAAREAAMGITRDYSTAAPATATAAEPGPEADVEAGEASEQGVQGEPQEPMVEPTTETSRYVEPAAPAYQPLRQAQDEPADAGRSDEMRAAPAGNLRRLENITEQILIELRRSNDAGADFSVSKLMAGITMVISLALLVYAYLYKDYPTTLQSLLLLGLMLQSITISLLLMGRQK